MARYRFTVEYLGSDFAGWQVQPARVTVQGALESALATALRETVTVVGAGRTDAGVHARGQVAHFDSRADFDPHRLEHSLNALTPPGVGVRNLAACPPDFHARFSALSRTYRYRFTRAFRPLAAAQAARFLHPFDVDLLAASFAECVGDHDFVNFSLPRNDGKSTRCRVMRAEYLGEDERTGVATLEIRADRFLHRMVRALVGAAYDTARGALPGGSVGKYLLQPPDRTWTFAPAEGLCLESVAYPEEAWGAEPAAEVDGGAHGLG